MKNKTILNNEFLHSLSFLNALIMVFYTMIHNNGGVGVLTAIMVGVFLVIPQLLLYLFINKKNKSILFLVFKIILVILGFVITFVMFNFTSESINIFMIFNFILLLIIFMTIIKEFKK